MYLQDQLKGTQYFLVDFTRSELLQPPGPGGAARLTVHPEEPAILFTKSKKGAKVPHPPHDLSKSWSGSSYRGSAGLPASCSPK